MKDQEKRAFYKEKILVEIAKIEEELGHLGIKDPKSGDWGARLTEENEGDSADTNTLADRDEEFLGRANVLGEVEMQYKELVHALDKINHHPELYGICEVSGQPIEEDRLEANPAARTCKAHMN